MDLGSDNFRKTDRKKELEKEREREREREMMMMKLMIIIMMMMIVMMEKHIVLQVLCFVQYSSSIALN